MPLFNLTILSYRNIKMTATWWVKCCAQHFTQNWRGKPLYTLTTIIGLIGSTKTGTGLKVYCDRDTNEYPTGIKISKSEIEALDIRRADFHGDWNYTLLPNPDNVSVIS